MITKWNNSLFTGIKELDDENKEFFKCINNLIDACNKGKGKSEIHATLNYLYYFVNFHLEIEEKYMRKYGYLKTFQHTAMHDIFRRSFNDLQREFEYEGVKTKPILHLINMLVNWLITHVNRDDRDLAEFFRVKNGISME